MRKGAVIYEGRKIEKHEDGSKHSYHVFRRPQKARDGATVRHYVHEKELANA